MNIALLIDEYRNPQAGTEGQLLLLTRELQARGHVVRLGVLRDTPYLRAGRYPATVQVLGVRRMSDPRSWLRVFRWGRTLVRNGFGIVQVFFNDASIIGPWPLRLAGLHVIVCRRDMGFWCTPAITAGLRLAGPAVSAIVANSRAAGETACRREWLPPRKLTVIGNGIGPASDSDAGGASAVPPAPTDGRIGLVANVRPIKRIGDLISAFAHIAPAHPQAELVIVGDGDVTGLQAQAARLGVGARIQFTGKIEQPSAWIQSFSIGVLCSSSEGLSNSILEYMQAGLPVVATDTGGNPELVVHGHTGLLVPVGDPTALAQALDSLLKDRVRARAMGLAGRERLRTQFGIERMISAHLTLYRELLGPAAANDVADASQSGPT